MIEQTISFAALTKGMQRCVREWILPALSDPWARLQAEQLAALLGSLPRSFGVEAAAAIRSDSREAAALLERLGVKPDAQRTNDSIEALMDENAALKRLLMKAADELRKKDDELAREALSEVQGFFMRSLGREMAAVSGAKKDDELAREALSEVQGFFMRSLGREMAAVSGADSFEALTSRDKGIAES